MIFTINGTKNDECGSTAARSSNGFPDCCVKCFLTNSLWNVRGLVLLWSGDPPYQMNVKSKLQKIGWITLVLKTAKYLNKIEKIPLVFDCCKFMKEYTLATNFRYWSSCKRCRDTLQFGHVIVPVISEVVSHSNRKWLPMIHAFFHLRPKK